MSRQGASLVELAVVLTIMLAISGVAIPLCASHLEAARESATLNGLSSARDALMQYASDTRPLLCDGLSTVAVESDRFELKWLFSNPVTGTNAQDFNPATGCGWRGPYLELPGNVSGNLGTAEVLDGWRNPFVTQYVNPGVSPRDVRIVSPGADGIVDVPQNIATGSLTQADIGDDIYVSIRIP